MSGTLYQSAASGEIANGATYPNDGDDGTAASVGVPGELVQDDVFRVRGRLGYHEALTYTDPADGANLRGGSGSTAGEHTWAPWSLERRLMHAYNDATMVMSLDGGYTWSTELNVPGATFKGAACQADSTANVHITGGGIGVFSVNGPSSPGATWNQTAIAGTTPCAPECIVADPFRASTYWVGGTDNAVPKVWSQVSVLGVAPTQTQYVLAGGTAPVNVLAVGRTTVLAASNTAGTSRLWAITPGGSVAAQTPPSTTFIVDIQWLDSYGWFVLIASNGTSALEVWTSPTGLTGSWTARGGVTFLANTWVPNANVRGSCIVGPLSYGVYLPSSFVAGALPCIIALPLMCAVPSSKAALATSSDGGVTWQLSPDPVGRHTTLSPNNKGTRARIVQNRIVVYGYNAAGNVANAWGMRGGKY